jgi:cell pole-organizing protein PopZ
MTDENNTDEEPSIEEILSSIRDIISDEDEDGEQPAAAEANEASAPAQVEESPAEEKSEPVVVDEAPSTPVSEDTNDDDDILDLANFAQENDDVDAEIQKEIDTEDSSDPLAGIDLGHPEDDLDITDTPVDDGLSEILEVESVTEKKEEPIKEESIEDEASIPVPTIEEPIQDSDDDDALIDKIAETATVGAMAKLAENLAISNSVEGTTLEDIVRELLRPMIKTWLDDNLPNTIDRLVSKELERLAEKAIRK